MVQRSIEAGSLQLIQRQVLGDFASEQPVTAAIADIVGAPRANGPTAFPSRRALRRAELHKIIPLSNTTIYEMEQRGEFPKRFYLTPRCVVWDSDDVYAWLDARKQAEQQTKIGRDGSR
ncbi:MAG: AlpA family phage regulatory protein [Steroidobacteraceae bacterium]